jgi:hypothetical protein
MKKDFKFCFCLTSVKWILKHLRVADRDTFSKMLVHNEMSLTPRVLGLKRKFKKKRRTAKQIRATKKLIAFNKRRRARR